ncbi:putative peroxisomal acyl-coenzyme A oxidase 3 [Apostichopus japonicus]|uniref:Putative peroxisomal acyl-coenzyme A oxidase 3 n=1 Tax=Stichopus japonicus TaxID=307972 RepID=A0A2G8L7I6_STIJA|nr:putative peroxisomal acyl-coenzyme A oxidase 3 [Apostichopus japonicus]
MDQGFSIVEEAERITASRGNLNHETPRAIDFKNAEDQARRMLEEFPPGPLSLYREKASFRWQDMKILLDGAENVLLKYKVWKRMESDPLFHRPSRPMTIEEHRDMSTKQFRRFIEYQFTPYFMLRENFPLQLKAYLWLQEALNMYDASLSLRFNVHFGLFSGAILTAGSSRHAQFIDKGMHGESYTIISSASGRIRKYNICSNHENGHTAWHGNGRCDDCDHIPRTLLCCAISISAENMFSAST